MEDQSASLTQDVKRRIKKADKNFANQANQVDLAVSASSPAVLATNERKIEKLEQEKLDLREKLQDPQKPQHSYGELFEFSMKPPSRPCKICDYLRFNLRQIILRQVFPGPVHHRRENGLLNTNFSLPFRMLAGQNTPILGNGAAGEN